MNSIARWKSQLETKLGKMSMCLSHPSWLFNDRNLLLFYFSLVEKKYQDQIRLIENEFSREKELMLMQTCHLRQDIEKQMISVQEQIGKMRKNIIGLEEVSVHEIGDGSDVVNVVAYWLTKTPPPDNSFIVLY